MSRFVRAFPAEEVERVRATRLADLAEQRGNPVQVVGVVTGKALYGTHQYGFSETGTVESNKQLTRDDLQAFWRQHFVPGNAALVVTGAITVPELRKLAQTAFGSWPRGTAAPAKLGVPDAAPPRLVIVDRPGSPQTQLRVATFGVPRSSPDYVPVRVMNTILGGMFASRINMNLREEHGYTYGANSQFPFWRSGGPFSVATGVRTDVTAPAVHEVMLELKKMSETRVTPQELTLAKDAITLQLPALFETNDRTAGKPVDALHARAAAELLLESRPSRSRSSMRRRCRTSRRNTWCPTSSRSWPSATARRSAKSSRKSSEPRRKSGTPTARP